MSNEQKLGCDHCKFALIVDYGYSNYTVEGSTFHCLKNIHPKSGEDWFYGEAKDFGKTCASWGGGGMTELDCDGETPWPNDPELAEFYIDFGGSRAIES